MNTKDKGFIVESKLIHECAKRCVTVNQPMGDNAPYDFIIDIQGALLRVQCKTLRVDIQNENRYVSETHKKSGHKRDTKTTYKGLADWFFLYCIAEDFWVCIPVDDARSTVTFINDFDVKPKNRAKIIQNHQKFFTNPD